MDTKVWNDILKDIYSQIELDSCLKTSIEKVTELLGVEIGSLMLLDKENQELSIKVAKGLSEDIVKNAKTRIGEGVSGWVAKNREPLLIENIGRDKRFTKRNGKYHNNSLLSAPLLAKDHLLGVINVNNKSTKEVFNEEDLAVLKEISIHISDAIDKALKYEEVKRLSQLKLDFVSTVSHELRSPLSSVREAINLILDRVTGDINKEQEHFLNISRNNLDRVIRLINELLDLSKLEAGSIDTKRRFEDICAVMKQAYETLKIDADRKNIRLKLELPPKDIDMWFDPDQIIRAVVNLLGNAIKFTQDNGLVEIKLEDLGRFIKISVIDNGPGIAENDIDRIFDKFYCVVKAKSSGEKSTGLGLSIAKEIVELHRGRIWVDSQIGMGARFSFTLPKDIRTV
jgi:signal transduction histidine kinase